MKRADAMRAHCPMCRAYPGQPCVGKRGVRKAPHLARFPKGRKSAEPAPPPAPVRPPKVGFYYSDEWREVRYKALKLHGATCQCCGARGTRGKPLHVDHIKPRSKFPELALELSNLQVLCEDCNLGKRAWDDTDWRTVA